MSLLTFEVFQIHDTFLQVVTVKYKLPWLKIGQYATDVASLSFVGGKDILDFP